MAHGGTWRGKTTGLQLLPTAEDIQTRISRICQTWLSHLSYRGISGSMDPPSKGTKSLHNFVSADQLNKLLEPLANFVFTIQSTEYIQEYEATTALDTTELNRYVDLLAALTMPEPEIKAINIFKIRELQRETMDLVSATTTLTDSLVTPKMSKEASALLNALKSLLTSLDILVETTEVVDSSVSSKMLNAFMKTELEMGHCCHQCYYYYCTTVIC